MSLKLRKFFSSEFTRSKGKKLKLDFSSDDSGNFSSERELHYLNSVKKNKKILCFNKKSNRPESEYSCQTSHNSGAFTYAASKDDTEQISEETGI